MNAVVVGDQVLVPGRVIEIGAGGVGTLVDFKESFPDAAYTQTWVPSSAAIPATLVDELHDALRELVESQNGPPLMRPSRLKDWTTAMDKAVAAIGRFEALKERAA